MERFHLRHKISITENDTLSIKYMSPAKASCGSAPFKLTIIYATHNDHLMLCLPAAK